MQFSQKYDFRHITTSFHYAQANGEAERAVQTTKQILRQADPFLALMIYRATPLQATDVSLAQLILGRQIRTTVPTLESKLQPVWPDLQHMRQVDERAKQGYRHAYNTRHDVQPLLELQPGLSVAVKLDSGKGWTKMATDLKRCDSPRSYFVQTDGGVLRQNRRRLRPLLSTPNTSEKGGEDHVECDGEPHSPAPAFDPPPVTVPVTPIHMTSSGRLVKPPDRYGEYVK